MITRNLKLVVVTLAFLCASLVFVKPSSFADSRPSTLDEELAAALSANGFTGTAGTMPAKGGRTDLSDDLIKQAVDHMISL